MCQEERSRKWVVLPPEDELDDLGHVFGRVLCFTGSDTETFGSTICKGMSCEREQRRKRTGTGEAGGDKDFCKAREAIDKGSACDCPVMSADIGMAGVYADVDENSKDDECDDGGHLEESKPIF